MLGGRAPAGRAASSSTTATAISWPARWPSCWRARAARSSSSRATTTIAPFCAETLEDVLVRERLHACGVAHAHRHRAARASSRAGSRSRTRTASRSSWPRPGSSSSPSASPTTRSSTSSTAAARAVFRIGDCVAPRLLAEAVFDGHRLAREIDGDDPEVALPWLRERVGDSDELPPAAGAAARSPSCLPRPEPAAARLRVRRRHGRRGRAHRRAAARGGADAVVAVGRGAGDAIERCRTLAERYGARLAVSRPQVEAGRATRAELVGASGDTVAPRTYLALGISGALPHLVGMAEQPDDRGRQSQPHGAHLRARRSRRGRRCRRDDRRAARSHRAGATGALNRPARVRSSRGGIPPFRH